MAEISTNVPIPADLSRPVLRPRRPVSAYATRALRHAILTLALFIFLFPVYVMVTSSAKTRLELFQQPPTIFPQQPNFDGYTDLFVNRQFGRALLNSLIIVGVSVAVAIFLGMLAAYSLARFRLPWKLNGLVAFWILSTRMLPPIVTIVPVFQIINSLRLVNTYLGLILVYVTFSLPFAVWMIRSFVIEIPADLEEAAMVDGASRWQAMWRVTLPLVRPGLVATALFITIDTYNEFLFALILSSTPAVTPMSVATASLVAKIQVQWQAMNSGGTLAILPILLMALLLQRHLVRGLTLGAVK